MREGDYTASASSGSSVLTIWSKHPFLYIYVDISKRSIYCSVLLKPNSKVNHTCLF